MATVNISVDVEADTAEEAASALADMFERVARPRLLVCDDERVTLPVNGDAAKRGAASLAARGFGLSQS